MLFYLHQRWQSVRLLGPLWLMRRGFLGCSVERVPSAAIGSAGKDVLTSSNVWHGDRTWWWCQGSVTPVPVLQFCNMSLHSLESVSILEFNGAKDRSACLIVLTVILCLNIKQNIERRGYVERRSSHPNFFWADTRLSWVLITNPWPAYMYLFLSVCGLRLIAMVDQNICSIDRNTLS